MRGLGATILVVGLGGLLSPLFGVQFKLVRAVSESLGMTTPAASGILIGAGLLLMLVDAMFRSRTSPSESISRLERGLARVGPTLDEIVSNSPEGLLRETVAKIFPFYGEITRRNLKEKPSDVDKDIAARVGVTEDDMILFHSAVFRAAVSNQRVAKK